MRRLALLSFPHQATPSRVSPNLVMLHLALPSTLSRSVLLCLTIRYATLAGFASSGNARPDVVPRRVSRCLVRSSYAVFTLTGLPDLVIPSATLLVTTFHTVLPSLHRLVHPLQDLLYLVIPSLTLLGSAHHPVLSGFLMPTSILAGFSQHRHTSHDLRNALPHSVISSFFYIKFNPNEFCLT